MKKLLIFACASALSFAAKAQKFNIGIDFQAAFPLSGYNVNSADETFPLNFNNAATGTGIGGMIDITYQTAGKWSFGLEVGQLQFLEKTHSIDYTILFFTITANGNHKAIATPILLKSQYFFLNGNFKPYVALGAGYMFYQPELNVDVLGSKTEVLAPNQNGFLVSPRIGFQYRLTPKIAIDLEAQFNYAFNKVENEMGIVNFEDGSSEVLQNLSMSETQNIAISLGLVYTLLAK